MTDLVSTASAKVDTAPSIQDEFQSLIDVLRKSDAESAKRMITKNPQLLTIKDDSDRSVIHWACSGGCLPIVQFVIGHDPSLVNKIDQAGWSPLLIAVSAGRTDVVNYLLSIDANVNARTHHGQNALHYAASKNHIQICQLLIDHGVDVNVQDEYGASSLHRAASKGNGHIVEKILACDGVKVRIDLTDSEGNTPLHLACEENRQDVAIMLARKSARLDIENKDKKTPLDFIKDAELIDKLKRAGGGAK